MIRKPAQAFRRKMSDTDSTRPYPRKYMADSMVKTSKVKDRRTLRFARLHELLDDVTQFNDG